MSTIEGLQFFESAQECQTDRWQAPLLAKAISLIQSYGRFFTYFADKTYQTLTYTVDAQMTDPVSLSQKKLVVCLHGLNNNPRQFKQILKEMGNPADTDIYIPYILDKGNGPLDDMVQPIFDKIAEWAKTDGDKELVLVGISNGGRVARAIEARLKEENTGNIKKLRFVSIVGACRGSSLATLAQRLHLSWLMRKNISAEMPTNSDRIQKLNAKWTKRLDNTNLQREYYFIASPHDWHVPNYDSTLMEVPKKFPAHYAIATGHGHNSIVNGSAKAIAKIILKDYQDPI